ncbi:DNA circularization protein [Cupriavidus gilardii]|uniref:DNA circularization protein n=1 Tax=Cupriavidus gilardii TaxID=82541 RepID=UPI0021B4B1F9|nr:DNA circularization N-terminal domain-containing protein [Cupriavidus gilardii]UXC35164.1 DNA circularization N-terminal domain-containing protein [Cupriavidus gilardii]
MAWSDTLQEASFRGVRFDCRRTQDDVPRDVAGHEYPYVDGEDTEDLGRKARRFAISAVFFGEDYEARLQAFLKACDERGPAELVHPIYGSIPSVQVLDYQVVHDAEAPDFCTVDLTFKEATPGNPFFVQQLPAQAATAATQLAEVAQESGTSIFATALEGIKTVKTNLTRLNNLRSVLTGTLGGLRSVVQGFTGTTMDLIDFPRAFVADVVGMLHHLVDLRSFDRASLLSDWKDLDRQLGQIVELPARVAAGTASSADLGGSAPGTPGGAPGDGSGNPGVVAALKPIPARPEDVAVVTALVKTAVATVKAATAGEILAGQADEPSLSPVDVELIASDARTAIQDAIDIHREIYPIETARPVIEALRDAAHGVQEAAIAVIDVRPPLIRRKVDVAGNLHLVAFRWYGDYRRAGELLRLNPALRNPNFLEPGDLLNAYAR